MFSSCSHTYNCTPAGVHLSFSWRDLFVVSLFLATQNMCVMDIGLPQGNNRTCFLCPQKSPIYHQKSLSCHLPHGTWVAAPYWMLGALIHCSTLQHSATHSAILRSIFVWHERHESAYMPASSESFFAFFVTFFWETQEIDGSSQLLDREMHCISYVPYCPWWTSLLLLETVI